MAFVGSRPRRNLREPSQSRDSNALRASVLEAALELGISSSRAVADLIFNTVDEEDEVRILFFLFFLFRFALFPPFFSLATVFFLGRLPNFPFLRIEQKLSLLTTHRLTVSWLWFFSSSVAHPYVVYGKPWWRAMRIVPRTEIPSHSKVP
jgi:hypothetical protein